MCCNRPWPPLLPEYHHEHVNDCKAAAQLTHADVCALSGVRGPAAHEDHDEHPAGTHLDLDRTQSVKRPPAE